MNKLCCWLVTACARCWAVRACLQASKVVCINLGLLDQDVSESKCEKHQAVNVQVDLNIPP